MYRPLPVLVVLFLVIMSAAAYAQEAGQAVGNPIGGVAITGLNTMLKPVKVMNFELPIVGWLVVGIIALLFIGMFIKPILIIMAILVILTVAAWFLSSMGFF